MRAAGEHPMTPETVPVLTPDEIAGERVRDRAGMTVTVWVLFAAIGCVLGVLWAHLGGVL